MIDTVKATIEGVIEISAIVAALGYLVVHFIEKCIDKKLDGKLARYNTVLENKEYISKTKFDAEFAVYRNLSIAFFNMVRDMSIMVPQYATVSKDKVKREEEDRRHFDIAWTSAVAAQNELNGSAVFIPVNFFDAYEQIWQLCRQQLLEYEDRTNLSFQEPPQTWSRAAYKRTAEINDKFKQLNIEIRDYLDKLDVI